MKDHTRELDVYKFDHERNPFKKIRLFFARRRFAKQRAHKGFCDWDMWDLDTFWSQLFIDSLTEFKEKSDGIPGCFILEDGTYVEIKGIKDRRSMAKMNQFPFPIQMWGAREMKPYLDYMKRQYGDNWIDKF